MRFLFDFCTRKPQSLWMLYFDKTRKKNALSVAFYRLFKAVMLQ